MWKILSSVSFWIVVIEFHFLLNCARDQQQGNITHTTTTLSQARYQLAATSSNELVFFAGGYNSTGKVIEWIFTM
jgi:hypothetical protein